MPEQWTTTNITDQTGKRVVITGANSGIGFEAAKELAGKGAEVILAVRSVARGETAKAVITRAHPRASVTVMQLDLSKQQNVHSFVDSFNQRFDGISVLINNAGVMAPPYTKTEDGFELQFGTNHLGHFALTGLLLPQLLKTAQSRVVVVSSMAHERGEIHFDNLDGSKGYRRWAFYGQSKLANLLFMRELQRRLRAADAQTIAVGCHPGFASTQLVANGMGAVFSGLSRPFAQTAAMGALPTLFATCDLGIVGGEYIGPNGFRGMRGYPGPSSSTARSNDMDLARRLWQVSEQLTKIDFQLSP